MNMLDKTLEQAAKDLRSCLKKDNLIAEYTNTLFLSFLFCYFHHIDSCLYMYINIYKKKRVEKLASDYHTNYFSRGKVRPLLNAIAGIAVVGIILSRKPQ